MTRRQVEYSLWIILGLSFIAWSLITDGLYETVALLIAMAILMLGIQLFGWFAFWVARKIGR